MNKPVAWSYEKLGSMERQAMDLADELSRENTQIGVESARLLRMLAITVYMQGEEIAKCHVNLPKEPLKPDFWTDGKHYVNTEKSNLCTIPLYTHPVKDLTDDLRIRELESEIERLQDQLNEFLVARDLAILRKAQEK